MKDNTHRETALAWWNRKITNRILLAESFYSNRKVESLTGLEIEIIWKLKWKS